MTDSADGRAAAELAAALGARLGLRVVLVHVLDGVRGGVPDGSTVRQRHASAECALATIARAVDDRVETRIAFGNRAERLAQVAAEEGADVIVLGSRPCGAGARHLRCTLARDLEAATPVPILIVPPETRKRGHRRLALVESAAAR